MSKYDVSNMSKRIKEGNYVYLDSVEYKVEELFKESSSWDGKKRSGKSTIWWVKLDREDGSITMPRSEVARGMMG